MCCHTSSNTGQINGSCIFLQKMIGRELLLFAFSHNIMELLARAAFSVEFGSTTSGPELPSFERFKAKWQWIDRNRFIPGVHDDFTAEVFTDTKDEILKFANFQLQHNQPKDDYREFLQLAIIFLGSSPTRGIHFNSPGAVHHARWLSKVLYCLKIWLFHDQFKLTA